MITSMYYVLDLSMGRAGLATATLVPVSGSTNLTVHVSDVDAEPERFNERLTKIALLRDAMNRAEPVRVTTVEGKSGLEVDEVTRVTRDWLLAEGKPEVAVGLVLNLRTLARHGTSSAGEASDITQVTLYDPAGARFVTSALSLQMQERGTADAILATLTEGLHAGTAVRLDLMRDPRSKTTWIVGATEQRGQAVEQVIDGFVESLGLRMAGRWPLAEVYITTAPRLIGPRRVVDPALFTPDRVLLLVPQGSQMATWLERALAESRRVRIGHVILGASEQAEPGVSDLDASLDDGVPGETSDPAVTDLTASLLTSLVVMAPHASAARPVWTCVRQEALEQPPSIECIPGTPATIASVGGLQVPHRAAWEGTGCFVHGVYRIQVISPVQPVILVDGVAPCCPVGIPLEKAKEEVTAELAAGRLESGLQRIAYQETVSISKARTTPDLQVWMVHICVEGSHTVRIAFDAWRCGYRLALDVFRVA